MATVALNVNRTVAAAVLETAYRLTVLTNVVRYRLEGWRWIVEWRNATRESVAEILACVDPFAPVGDNPVVVATVMETLQSLLHDLTTFATQRGNADDTRLHGGVVDHLNTTTRGTWNAVHSPRINNPSEPALDVCFRLGEALALEDLRSVTQYPIEAGTAFASVIDNSTTPFNDLNLPGEI